MEKIFTKFSHSDNLFKQQSLYVAEISELKYIIERSNKKTFLCLDELIEMKSCRLEQKDIADIKLLNRHVKPSKRRQIRIHILSTIMRIKWKVRAKLIALLKLLNLFGVVRSFYRFLLKLFN